MKLAWLAISAGLLVGACAPTPASGQPASRPATDAATKPALKAVDLRYGIYLARLETHTTLSPDGLLRQVRTDNKSYGPNDIDPKNERIEIRQGRLTREQMAGLAELFAGWDSLSDEPYPGVADGGDVKIRYGNKTVSGGSAVPEQVQQIRLRINELSRTMPVVAE